MIPSEAKIQVKVTDTVSDVVKHNNPISCAIKAQSPCVMMGFHFVRITDSQR